MDLPIDAAVEVAMEAVASLDTSNQTEVDDVVGRLHDLCMARMMHGASVHRKMQALTALLCLAPAEGEDMVARWRGGLPYLLRQSSDARWYDHAKALVHLACTGARRDDAFPEEEDDTGVGAVLEAHLHAVEGERKPGSDAPLLSSIIRTELILTIYNLGLFSMAYNGMVRMVEDPTLSVSCAMELCRFLVTTQNPLYHAAFVKVVTSMIHNSAVPWKYKYECLAKLDSRSGIRSVMNADLIPAVPHIPILQAAYRRLALHALGFQGGEPRLGARVSGDVDAGSDTSTELVDRLTYGGMAAGAYLSIWEKRREKVDAAPTTFGDDTPKEEEEEEDETEEEEEEEEEDEEEDETEEARKEVENVLIEVAKTEHIPARQRADLADVLLSKGSVEARIQGRIIIQGVGRERGEAAGAGQSWGVPGISGIRTLYEDAENVHDETLAESGEAFLEELAQKTASGQYTLVAWEDTMAEIKALLQDAATRGKVTSDSVADAERALDRIAIDRTTMTSQRLTLAEVLVMCWGKLLSPACAPHQSLLKERLVEELTEMNVSDDSGCTSGHFMRMVNVFSSVTEGGLRISWDSQVIGNVTGRVGASLRLGTERVREVVADGAMDEPTSEEQDAYVAWAASVRRALWAEMEAEFVASGHMTRDAFQAAFSAAFTRYIPGWLAPSRLGPVPPVPPSPEDRHLLHPPSQKAGGAA